MRPVCPILRVRSFKRRSPPTAPTRSARTHKRTVNLTRKHHVRLRPATYLHSPLAPTHVLVHNCVPAYCSGAAVTFASVWFFPTRRCARNYSRPTHTCCTCAYKPRYTCIARALQRRFRSTTFGSRRGRPQPRRSVSPACRPSRPDRNFSVALSAGLHRFARASRATRRAANPSRA